MSIEQTTQLIQLILNAVLMLGACGVMREHLTNAMSISTYWCHMRK